MRGLSAWGAKLRRAWLLLVCAALFAAGLRTASEPRNVAGAAPATPAAPGAAARWWKGNTHTHTLWSDGDGAPELVARWYREHGYHFLVLSDHNLLSAGERWFPVSEEPGSRLRPEHLAELEQLFGAGSVATRETEGRREMRLATLTELRPRFEEPGRFLFVQGEEITTSFEKLPVHLNGLNLLEPIAPLAGATLVETLQRNLDAVAEQGRRLGRPVLAHVNHPNFGWAFGPADLARMRGERFFEVYNGHGAVRNRGDETRPSTERMWDEANTLRLAELGLEPLYGLASDDAHDHHGAHGAPPGRGWIQVRATALDADALIAALRAGEFYASSGVELEEVAVGGGRYQLRIAAEPGLEYTTRFLGTRRTPEGLGPAGEVLLETQDNPAVYEFRGDELYVRATVLSSREHPDPQAAGDRESAWTQPAIPGAER